MWCSNGKLNGKCVHFVFFFLLRSLTLVVTEASVSDPLNCKMEEKFILSVVTIKMFILTDNTDKIKAEAEILRFSGSGFVLKFTHFVT